MKALLVTREYPPHIYGGAGVVADQLSRALARRMARGGALLRSARAAKRRHRAARLHAVGAHGRQGRPALRARAGDAVDRPGHGARRGGRRRRARPHLVRRHGRALDQHALPHPARRHAAQHGAAAALEGRSARQRLPGVVVDREDRGGVGAPGDRRVAQDARGHPRILQGRSRARRRHPQRHRSRPVPAHDGPRRARSPRRPRAVRALRRTHHRPEGDLPPAGGGARAAGRRAGGPVRLRARHAGDRGAAAPRGGRPAQREVDQRDGAGRPW